MARPSVHSVTSIRSVRRKRPSCVSQSNVVPTPDVVAYVKRMATASFIHSVCDAMFFTSFHTTSGGDRRSTLTCIRRTRRQTNCVLGDAERPSRVKIEQDRVLRAYIRRQVYPYSTANRNRLSTAGFGPFGVRKTEDLATLPPIAWSEVGDGSELLLRPHRISITKLGAPSLAVRVLFATLFGRRRALNQRVIEPIYKPLLWLVQDGVPVGLTALDIERLSELGRRWLESAGVGGADVIASIIPN